VVGLVGVGWSTLVSVVLAFTQQLLMAVLAGNLFTSLATFAKEQNLFLFGGKC
jgi:hypothetical protein